ncbi:MAG: matrixin family metalloprotease [Deltaproteobacteria bacterium]|nr:matrixin family metalloprotease [Deltaproteobacteria bacterium]
MLRPIIAGLGCLLVALPAGAWKVIEEGKQWDLSLGPLPYQIDAAGSEDITDGSDIEAIRHSFLNWQCVLCASLEFLYEGEAPTRSVDRDGYNVVFWVENEADWPLGPGTFSSSILGVNTNGGGPDDSDIIFNGVSYVWSTTDPMTGDADVESIAIHEIGHFVGLAHPCEDEADINTCVPPERAVMYPMWDGSIGRIPRQDDIDGVCAMYPPGKTACEGYKVVGDTCERDCDCAEGVRCLLGENGQRYCSWLCEGESAHCPRHMVCVLGPRPSQDVPAPGVCMRYEDPGALPPAAMCDRGTQCASDNCSVVPALGTWVCVQACSGDADCPVGWICNSSRCVMTDRGVPCPGPEEDGCGCSAAAGGISLSGLALVGLLALLRRRRGHWSAIALLALVAVPARATVIAPLDLPRLIELSDAIVHGRVVGISTWESSPRGMIFTVVDVAVSNVAKGEAAPGGRIQVYVAGGTFGERRTIVPGASRFAVGEEVVLFLSRWRDHLVPVAVGAGKLLVDRTRPDGPCVRDPGTTVPVYSVTAAGQPQLTAAGRLPDRPLDQLLREVRARVEASRTGGRP